MNEKILFVDDDPNILSALKRQLHKEFNLEVAEGGEKGIETVEKKGPFAVVVADMRMPVMDGIQFLRKVKESSPESVRMMLTGNADLQTAVDAVNEGNIFRFLVKPCPQETLANSLTAGIDQYRLIRVEKELLEKTLIGSVKVLTEILSLVNPMAFSQATRLRSYVSHIVKQLNLPNAWQFEIATMLSQIGCITIPPDILAMIYAREKLSKDKQKMYSSHPSVGSKILAHIPRLELIAKMIEGQQKPYKTFTQPKGGLRNYMITMGSQILKVVIDFDKLVNQGFSYKIVLAKLGSHTGEYNPYMLEALETFQEDESKKKIQIKKMMINELRSGLIAEEDIVAKNKVLLVQRGQEITYTVLIRLHNFNKGVGIVEPVSVQIISQTVNKTDII